MQRGQRLVAHVVGRPRPVAAQPRHHRHALVDRRLDDDPGADQPAGVDRRGDPVQVVLVRPQRVERHPPDVTERRHDEQPHVAGTTVLGGHAAHPGETGRGVAGEVLEVLGGDRTAPAAHRERAAAAGLVEGLGVPAAAGRVAVLHPRDVRDRRAQDAEHAGRHVAAGTAAGEVRTDPQHRTGRRHRAVLADRPVGEPHDRAELDPAGRRVDHRVRRRPRCSRRSRRRSARSASRHRRRPRAAAAGSRRAPVRGAGSNRCAGTPSDVPSTSPGTSSACTAATVAPTAATSTDDRVGELEYAVPCSGGSTIRARSQPARRPPTSDVDVPGWQVHDHLARLVEAAGGVAVDGARRPAVLGPGLPEQRRAGRVDADAVDAAVQPDGDRARRGRLVEADEQRVADLRRLAEQLDPLARRCGPRGARARCRRRAPTAAPATTPAGS